MAIFNPIEFLKQNPNLVLLIVLAPILLAIIAFVVMKFIENREEQRRARLLESMGGSGPSAVLQRTGALPLEDKVLPTPKSDKEMTIDDLKSREDKLREREERLKHRKLSELEEKERSVERKHITDVLKEERKLTDEMERERERVLQMEEFGNNRKRLVKLIELAEDRYNEGMMSEKNFRSIMASYQKELVEIDVEMAKIKGYDI
jgi:hypothetical protein